jgi:hypothetical protein
MIKSSRPDKYKEAPFEEPSRFKEGRRLSHRGMIKSFRPDTFIVDDLSSCFSDGGHLSLRLVIFNHEILSCTAPCVFVRIYYARNVKEGIVVRLEYGYNNGESGLLAGKGESGSSAFVRQMS